MVVLVEAGEGKGIMVRELNMMNMGWLWDSSSFTCSAQTSTSAFIFCNLLDCIILVGPGVQFFHKTVGQFSLLNHKHVDIQLE